MSNWINLDHDFGMPWVRLLVDLQRDTGKALLADINCCQEDKQVMADLLARNIAGIRPDLVGCTVFGICHGSHPLTLSIDVGHPSLPRVKPGERASQQWLEPCPVCGKAVACGDGNWYRRSDQMSHAGWRTDLVCSEACSKVEVAQPKQWKECLPPAEVASCDIPIEYDPKSYRNGIVKAALTLTNISEPMTDEPIKAGQQMIYRGQAFRCVRCNKLRLMNELKQCVETFNRSDMICKKCVEKP